MQTVQTWMPAAVPAALALGYIAYSLMLAY